jgi:hypothetical protein
VSELFAVRRPDDNELLGFVRQDAAGWTALTIFEGELGIAPAVDEARAIVQARGLSSLAEHWWHYMAADDSWQIVLIQEARPGYALLVEGYYSLPESPRREFDVDHLQRGDRLTLQRPDAT